MNQKLQAVQEWHNVDEAMFKNEIATRFQPAIMRGLVKSWPAVQQAAISPAAICNYIHAFDSGADVDAILMPPEINGRVSYNADMSGFNFVRNRLPVTKVLEQITRYAAFEKPPSVAVQSALISECLPQFFLENKMPLLGDAVPPRIWLGNQITTPAHIDESNNIACVVSGKRRFTLFPPEQARNLYLGPLDFNPTGSPISLVNFKNPNFDRFPRFKDALAAAQVAELAPGDALYIPTLWWHHVESLNELNILVNYWWKEAPNPTYLDPLMHCLLAVKGLPPDHKKAWGALFNHYAFDPQSDPTEQIPEYQQGILGKLTPDAVQKVKAWLIRRMQG